MTEAKYGIGWGLFGFALSISTDWPAWQTVAVVVSVSIGLLLVVSSLKDLT